MPDMQFHSPAFLRRATANVAVVCFWSCFTCVTFAAEATKKKSSGEETSTKSRPAKSAETKKSGTTKSKSPTSKGSTTAAKPSAEKKTAPAVPAKPKETPKPDESSKSGESPPPDKPQMTTPDEPPPKDVTTTNRATESKDHGEFSKAEAEEEARANAAASKNRGTATSSSDMAGWELIRYEERDYVTADSIHKFYRFHNLDVTGKSVWFRSPVLVMKAALGSQDLLINNIKFVLSDPVLELRGKPCFSRLDLCKLIDPVLRPSYIGSASQFDTVIIDPGHGGHDGGARGIYGYEKDFSLKLGLALKADLERKGLKVLMTRKNDTFISLGDRVKFANKVPNSIYVSLHFNSGKPTATGIETYALTPQGASSQYGARAVDANSFNGNRRDSENIALATAVHASVVHHFKLIDRGVKRARWSVLTGLERPGVLFEGGFVTNANDAKFIAADNFRTEMASTLGQAIMNYRRALQPR
jgi:N-acetylmuramoyl-L-alanine amidase